MPLSLSKATRGLRISRIGSCRWPAWLGCFTGKARCLYFLMTREYVRLRRPLLTRSRISATAASLARSGPAPYRVQGCLRLSAPCGTGRRLGREGDLRERARRHLRRGRDARLPGGQARDVITPQEAPRCWACHWLRPRSCSNRNRGAEGCAGRSHGCRNTDWRIRSADRVATGTT